MKNNHLECRLCPAGWYSKDYFESGNSIPADFSDCEECPVGRYQTNTGTSLRNYWSYPSDRFRAACSDCPAHNTKSGTGCTSYACACNACPAGYQSEAGEPCTGCPFGYHQDQSGVACKMCTAGKYANEETLATCKNCPAGKKNPGGIYSYLYNSPNDCTNCDVGRYSSSGSASCTDCPGGYYALAGSSSCTICPEGYFSEAVRLYPEFNEYCQQCSGGQVSGAGSTSCGTCAAGQYSDVSVCKKCPKGYYSSQNSASSCSGCTAGRFQNNEESTSCKLCSPGRYDTRVNFVGFQLTQLIVDCTEICQPSHYQNEEGKTSCKSCGIDRISFVYAADNEDTCVDCLLPIFTPIRI